MNLIYQSQFFKFFQSDRDRNFILDFGHKTVKFRFCQLLAFRQQLKNIDLESHFNGENKHGIEILMLCNKEHIFIFNTFEILDLRLLLQGTFTMTELNSMLS